ncbi:MAG: adenylate cyclase [Bacteroidales bacterium 45-6]|nr:MAG: adenylate cyclase [Bacteroidales bacterium 45-6]
MVGIEIERKFLVAGDFKGDAYEAKTIKQGYILSEGKGRNVRIRVKGDKGFITIKGPGSDSGTSRFEWEMEIPVDEAEQLLLICNEGKIEKVRHLVKSGKHTFEVDEFHGENEGLIVAEVELTDENEAFESPSWLGKEVTGDVRYYNSYLSQHPYSGWKNDRDQCQDT